MENHTSNLSHLTAKQLRKAARLVETIERHQATLAALVPISTNGHSTEKRRMSNAAKRKIRLSAKRRWKLAKLNGKNHL